jgi:hypothetical protein
LRKYSSDDPVIPAADKLQSELIPAYWPKIEGPLPKTAGMHRWVWDLRATAPTATHADYPISAVPHRTPLAPQGPLVLPGTYTVRLAADGKSETAPLVVKMDPRIHASAAELEALHAEQVKLAAALDALAAADLEAHSVEEQAAASPSASKFASATAALQVLLDGSKKEKESPGIDDVTEEAAGLYAQLDSADAAPTAAQRAAAADVEAEAAEVLPVWQEFKQKQLPAMNLQLRQSHQAEINPGQKPSNMPETGDED